MTDETAFLDATAQAELVRRGEASPVELVEAAIARIEKLNGQLNAVIHPLFERARARAASPELPDGPFRGVPCVVKDLDGTLAGAPYHM
ncbi:MAG: 6-aminohexanoate hydrolase, partial [Acidimicrobiia bacterium]